MQTQVAGWIWPTDCGLLTPAIGISRFISVFQNVILAFNIVLI
jgi:hypothetical protein